MKKARRTVHGCKDGCDKAAVDGDVDVVKDSMAEMEVGGVVGGRGGGRWLSCRATLAFFLFCWDGGLGIGSVEIEGNVG